MGTTTQARHEVAWAGQWRALRRTTGRQRRALGSSWVGFFVDMVDIYLPVIALAPAIAYFQPETLGAGEAGTLFFVTFAATLLGRPVGALVFGHLADTLGRRRVTIASIAGFSVCTILIGLLPGHADWGLAAPAALIGLRFLDGVFLGGEYTAATPLAFEHCPPRARGLFGGLLMSAYAAAYAAVSALVLVLLLLLPAGAYQAWGWRVPFLAGGLAGLVFLLWRTRVPESPLWQAAVASRQGYEGCGDAGGDPQASPRQAPVQVLLSGASRRDFVQVLVLMVGLWLVATSVVSVLPQRLLAHVGQSPVWVTTVLLAAQPVVIGGFVAAGMTSQKVGRRRALALGATVSGTAGLACYVLALTLPVAGWLLAVLVVATEVTTLAVWGVVTSYLNERFATNVRATGFGMAYSLALVPASFYAFYLTGLTRLMPERLTQLVLLGVGSLMALAGAGWGPETRDVDLARAGSPLAIDAPADVTSSDVAPGAPLRQDQ
ncbi:MFS transporter [Nocardioides bigeumensis]|uniref:MFS transporter n=1 Tax=Nocardioides bigeumensis TaxID=433657 RepID=UPI0031CF68FD